MLLGAIVLRAEERFVLSEALSPGCIYSVQTRVRLSGTLTVPVEKDKPPQQVRMQGVSRIDYDERILKPNPADGAARTLRIYRTMDFDRTVGEARQQTGLRDHVRRLVVLRKDRVEVPFSPDGPLRWGELDLIRTDVFVPALVKLLPRQSVAVGSTWIADQEAVGELTDLEKIEQGQLDCRLVELTQLGQRRLARIDFQGTLTGINEDGRNRQKLDGTCYVDLAGPSLSYLSLHGVHELLNPDAEVVGRIEGQFVLSRRCYTPQETSSVTGLEQLRDAALAGVSLQPNADNTLLLYENDTLGVRLQYPRHWRVSSQRGRQLMLDEARGSGILVTVEPLEAVPTPARYRREAQAFLEQHGGKALTASRPRALTDRIRTFTISGKLGDDLLWMEYLIVRGSHGGATLAATLQPRDVKTLQAEVAAIARSLQLYKPPS